MYGMLSTRDRRLIQLDVALWVVDVLLGTLTLLLLAV